MKFGAPAAPAPAPPAAGLVAESPTPSEENINKWKVEDIMLLIASKTKKPLDEVAKLVQEKIAAFQGLLTKQGAAAIVAEVLNVKIPFDQAPPKVELKQTLQAAAKVDLPPPAVPASPAVTKMIGEATAAMEASPPARKDQSVDVFEDLIEAMRAMNVPVVAKLAGIEKVLIELATTLIQAVSVQTSAIAKLEQRVGLLELQVRIDADQLPQIMYATGDNNTASVSPDVVQPSSTAPEEKPAKPTRKAKAKAAEETKAE